MAQIDAQSLNGEKVRVQLAGSRPTILYVFTPQCSWCVRNHDSVKTLAETAGGSYRIVGLSFTDRGLPEFLSANPLPFEIYANSSEAIANT
jgi:hypothetical protein